VYREDLTVLEVTIETMEPTIYPILFLFTTFCSYSIFLYQGDLSFQSKGKYLAKNSGGEG
jgi:uncharacterized membrane protein YiaA